MRFNIREAPLKKSIAYAVICLCLLLFSCSFVPTLGILPGAPILLVGAVCSIAYYEDVRYASFIALVFSVVETVINGANTLVYPLFYTAFAILCVWLYENFFVRNFLSWFCYTAGGLAVYSVISLFGPVTDWGIAAPDIFVSETMPEFAVSLALSLPMFPFFGYVKRKTDKE